MAVLAIRGGSPVLPQGIPVSWPMVDRADEDSLLAVFRSGAWWRGGTIEAQRESCCGRFERAFAEYHDAPFALVVSNGTVALEMALRAAGVGPGDEVIVPTLSFVVTASAVLPLGAYPVFADCDPRTWQIDVEAVEGLISPRTRAVCVVHFGGYPADLDRLTEIADSHGLALVEDAAHSHGSQWRGKGTGSWGSFGTFSFQNFKSLTCGEGGIILSRSEEGWQRLYAYHNLGRRESEGFYDFHTPASNHRLTDLQGALLLSQFRKLKDQVPRRMAAAERLGGLLRQIGGLEPLPPDSRITRRGYYYYLLRYDRERFRGLERNAFVAALRAEGVSYVGTGYGRPIHRNPLFRDMKVPGNHPNCDYAAVRCPVAERVTEEHLVTLLHPALLADGEVIDGIADAVAKIRDHAEELREKGAEG